MSRLSRAAWRILLASAAVAALSGCAPDLGPRAETKPLASYETAKSFAAAPSMWPQEAWWKAYNDPALDTLIEEALQGSPDLKMAAARVKAAESTADVYGSLLWPTIEGNGTVMETEMTQNIGFPAMFKPYLPKGFHNSGLFTLGLQYQLDLFGKNRANFAASLSTAEAAKAEQAEARLQIAAGMAALYAKLVQAEADLALAEDAVRIRSESASLVEKRYGTGIENDAALSQSHALIEAAKVQVEAIKAAGLRLRHAIAALSGKGPDYGLAINVTRNHSLTSPGLPDKIAADLLSRRPDVTAAKRNAEAAAHGIDAAEANFYPNVDITALYGYGALDVKNLLTAESELAGIGPAIHLPIFDYGRNTGLYRAANAKYEAAVALYDKTLSNALRDVADAYASRKALENELIHARKALADSENAYRVIRTRYEAGLARYMDVLAIEDRLIAQRMAVADFEADAFGYDIALIRALGGGYETKSGKTEDHHG